MISVLLKLMVYLKDAIIKVTAQKTVGKADVSIRHNKYSAWGT